MNRLLLIALLFSGLPVHAQATMCRSESVKHRFDVLNGYPHGRKGYVVDHVCALAQGGLDDVKNMQYQNIIEGHIKDRIENTPMGKIKYCTPSNSTPTRQVFNCK
jgi:hypothetical protein